jgi:hypothetical protein
MLGLGAAAAGLLLAAGRRHAAPDAGSRSVAPAPEVELALALTPAGVTPEQTGVPKGRRVHLTVVNRRPRPATLALDGYRDRLTIGAIAPGAEWHGQFLADRPGEDFAWIVDGEPAGRLAVQGSHLVEGHR